MSATPAAGEVQVVSALPMTRGRLELVCRTCGYGAVAAAAPAQCPMCRGSSWATAPATRGIDDEGAQWTRQ